MFMEVISIIISALALVVSVISFVKSNGQTIYQHIVCPFHYPPSNQQMAADFLCHIQHSRPNKIQPKMLSIVQICF